MSDFIIDGIQILELIHATTPCKVINELLSDLKNFEEVIAYEGYDSNKIKYFIEKQGADNFIPIKKNPKKKVLILIGLFTNIDTLLIIFSLD